MKLNSPSPAFGTLSPLAGRGVGKGRTVFLPLPLGEGRGEGKPRANLTLILSFSHREKGSRGSRHFRALDQTSFGRDG
jgi:hypothetical protein